LGGNTVGCGDRLELFGVCLEQVGRVDSLFAIRIGVLGGAGIGRYRMLLSDARFGVDVLENSPAEVVDKDACGLCLLVGLAFVPYFVSVSEENCVFLLS
jgi:hypothetical protein